MDQITFSLESNVDYSENSYYASVSNIDAYKLIKSWPTWGSFCLVVHGPKSCGKSHLAHIWSDISDASVIQLKTFPIESLPLLGNCVIEDIDCNIDEQKLLHVYNHIKNSKGFLLLTTSVAPSQLNISLPDLKSRIVSSPNISISEPDDELLVSYIVKQFSDRQLKITDDVIQYITKNISRSFESASEVVKVLDRDSLHDRRNITIPYIKDVLARVNNDVMA